MVYRLIILSVFVSFFIIGCKSDGNKKIDTTSRIEEGKAITQHTFKALSSTLKKSIENEGIPGALDYCNVHAIPITDSLSGVHNAKIKRTSLKTRNPENNPNAQEKEVLLKFAADLKNDRPLKAVVMKDGNHDVFYAPIIAQELCLKCHGNKDKIPEYDKIQSLYPNDKATEYLAGDLRGMWSVTFLD